LKDSLNNLIRTIDNISGVNDTPPPTVSEWLLYAGPATYINATQFSVVGDATAIFDNYRRVKATISGTDRYGTVTGASVYALGVTTVTLTLDSGVLDSSLSTIYYGLLDPANPSFDTTQIKTGVQKQTWVAFTTSGTSGTYTLTPNPAITSYAVSEKFNVTFNAASSTTNTININGLGAKSLKMYNSVGTKVDASFAVNQVSDIVYDGTDFVFLSLPQSILSGGAFTGAITAPTINGTTMQQGGVAMPRMALSTSQNTTSGTAIDFTSIPSWVKRITVMLNGVSTNGASALRFQIGDSGGIEITGYSGMGLRSVAGGSVGTGTFSAGYDSVGIGVAASSYSGHFVLINVSGNIWVASANIGMADASTMNTITGTKTLSDVLTQVRITTVNGTDTFDACSVNILYEG
jgi:hypothetical protein